MSALTITIDRTGMTGSPAPLVLSAEDDGTPLGVHAYAPPGRVGRVTYLPDEPDTHGSIPQAASLQQAILAFGVSAVAASESGMRALIAEVEAALARLSYQVTTMVGDGPAETWLATWGSIELADNSGRDYADLRDADPVYSVSIPVFPIPN